MEEGTETAVAETTEVGIKETREAVKGAAVLLILILKRLKDGAGVDDVMAIFAKFQTDEEFKKVLTEAYEGADKIKGEVTNVDLMEGFTLAKDLMDLLPEILAALKK